MYGLTKTDREAVLEKLRFQKQYLEENFHDFGTTQLPYADFFQNAWHNSHRYIAELNHRVWSLNNYAEQKGLSIVFATFTLPTEYHPKRTIKLRNGKTKLVRNDNFIDDEEHTPKNASKILGKIHRSVMNSKVMRALDKENRCYIAVREPHKDGTPHLHVAYFVPDVFVDNLKKAITRRFKDEHSKVETAIRNPTAYIMKYVLKTLDDLRENKELENLSDLTLWYIKHKIPRLTMSRTFISLDIYRALKGQHGLLKLTTMYQEDRLQIFLDPKTSQVLQIMDDYGDLWQKRRHIEKASEFKYQDKPIMRHDKKKLLPDFSLVLMDDEVIGYTNGHGFVEKLRKMPYQMTDLELIMHWQDLDFEDEKINRAYIANLHNELAKRNYADFEKVGLDYYAI